MHIVLNFTLPDDDVRVSGEVEEDTYGRSLIGYSDRELRRFFPVVMCLETLVRINLWHHRRLAAEGKSLKPLYESGVKYVAEPAKAEVWHDVLNIYAQGHGDCEDLASARAAELQFQGTPAVPCIRFKKLETPSGVITLVHVMVLWPDGYVEDPSKFLGMKGEY